MHNAHLPMSVHAILVSKMIPATARRVFLYVTPYAEMGIVRHPMSVHAILVIRKVLQSAVPVTRFVAQNVQTDFALNHTLVSVT